MSGNPTKGDTYGWTTTDEMDHLDHLGSYAERDRLTKDEKRSRRLRLLIAAKVAYSKRVVWKSIKKHNTLLHLNKLLKEGV